MESAHTLVYPPPRSDSNPKTVKISNDFFPQHPSSACVGKERKNLERSSETDAPSLLRGSNISCEETCGGGVVVYLYLEYNLRDTHPQHDDGSTVWVGCAADNEQRNVALMKRIYVQKYMSGQGLENRKPKKKTFLPPPWSTPQKSHPSTCENALLVASLSRPRRSKKTQDTRNKQNKIFLDSSRKLCSVFSRGFHQNNRPRQNLLRRYRAMAPQYAAEPPPPGAAGHSLQSRQKRYWLYIVRKRHLQQHLIPGCPPLPQIMHCSEGSTSTT